MSLRPYVQGFSIAAFDALVGSNDATARHELSARVDQVFHESRRDAAHTWVDRIVSGAVRTHPPQIEDETLQSVIVLCARRQPVRDNQNWDFWGALGHHAHDSFSTATDARRRLIAWLQYGRPRFTNRISSSWTTCAFLSNTEAQHLIDLASEEPLRSAWRREEAIAWLEDTRRQGHDLLWVCN